MPSVSSRRGFLPRFLGSQVPAAGGDQEFTELVPEV